MSECSAGLLSGRFTARAVHCTAHALATGESEDFRHASHESDNIKCADAGVRRRHRLAR
ncbi:protein of unknown function [Cupriavidus taiwanensis]|nr:protein of unknown function [Cupriavidus taiwanensis]